MALKPCPRCGKMISDKAEKCLKTRNNRRMMVAFPIIIICIILNCSFNYSEIGQEEFSIISKPTRQDSLKKVEEAKNFITNDLRLFELHGHVKSVSNYLPLDDGQIFDGNNGSGIYFFNKDGECRKRSEDFKGFVYDGDKRIIKAQYNDNDFDFLELKWNNNGELAGINYDIYDFSCNIHYDYNSNGDLIKTFQEASARGEESETIFIYDIIERDKYDNWIKRRVRQTSKLFSTYEDGPLDKPEINAKEKFEERIIEYYED